MSTGRFLDDEPGADAAEQAVIDAREEYLAWRIIETAGGGFAAVRKRARLIESATLDGLVTKLRQEG